MWIKKGLWAFIAICFVFAGARIYYWLTDDFRLANISYDSPTPAFFSAPSLTEEEKMSVMQLLDQPFFYIGKGSQSYAFVSADEKYVIKFFKFKHLKANSLVESLPDVYPFKAYKESVSSRKLRKLMSLFHGYEVAYTKNKEGSHLIYLHLGKTTDLQKNIVVIDKMGLKHTLPLDNVFFLIQDKGETLRSRLSRELDNQEIDQAKKTLGAILQMYIGEYKKGLYDHDHGVMQNSGFVGDQPFHLDLGKFNEDERMKDPAIYKEDFAQVIWKIDTWIEKNYPKDYEDLSLFLSNAYRAQTNESLSNQPKDPKLFSKKRKWLRL